MFTPASRRKASATKRGQNKLSFNFLVGQGERAYTNGQRPEDCPFPEGSDEASAWLFGWEGMMEDSK